MNNRASLHLALLVKHFHLLGGSERYAFEIIRRLLEKGHKIDLYAWQSDVSLSGNLAVRQVKDCWQFSSAFRLYHYARQVAGMLRYEKYDVVHSHERGFSQDILTQHCFSYRQGMKKYSWWRKIDQMYLSPRSLLYLWLEKQQMQTPWLAAVSEAIRRDIEENYGRDTNIRVIPPGVDTDRFHPQRVSEQRLLLRQKTGIKENELVVLFIGSEFKRKGLDYLIPAIGPNMRLFVVGRGERMPRYRALAEKNGVTGQVYFTGLIDAVDHYYALADVVVLPTLSEAFGMTVLEAMACGLPVVVSANAGVSELVRDKENGLILADFTSLRAMLRQLFDPQKRRFLGRAARQTAEHYTWDRTAESYEQLYYQIAEEKKKRIATAYGKT